MLSERDRLMIAVTLRAFVARDIERRGIADTYEPAALTVSAYDLIELAGELLTCFDGDNVEMVEALAEQVDEAMVEDAPDSDEIAQSIAAKTTAAQVLAKLDNAHPLEIERERRRLD